MSLLIPKQNYKNRLNICFDCPSYNPTLKQCKECGCFLILKAAFKSTKCPLGKWNEVKAYPDEDAPS